MEEMAAKMMCKILINGLSDTVKYSVNLRIVIAPSIIKR
jgi:hypothetical protein